MNVLVAYASKRGSTEEVARSIAEALRARGLSVRAEAAASVTNLDGYDAVLLGGALYMGRLHRDARRFLTTHREALATRPLAVFAMGPRTLEDREVAAARSQLDRALAKVPDVEPASVAIFGGVFDPAKLSFPLNRMAPSDARDLAAIEAWAAGVATAFAA